MHTCAQAHTFDDELGGGRRTAGGVGGRADVRALLVAARRRELNDAVAVEDLGAVGHGVAAGACPRDRRRRNAARDATLEERAGAAADRLLGRRVHLDHRHFAPCIHKPEKICSTSHETNVSLSLVYASDVTLLF